VSGQLRSTLALVVVCVVSFLAVAQVTPNADAYISTLQPSTNFGGAAVLNLQSGKMTSFVRFDLSSVPAGYNSSNVAKATLKLYVAAVTTGGSLNVNYVSGSWSESTITSNLQPAASV